MAEGKRSTRGKFAAAIVGLAVATTLVAVASPSQASFPGTNGLIAFVAPNPGNVFVVNPNNPVPTQVTNTGGYTHVKYNAAGNKLAASGAAGLVFLDPVAGSAVTVVPNTLGTDRRPAFNPDGSKLAFNNAANELLTIDTNGANRTTILAAAVQPDWSADGTFIAFANAAFTAIRRVSPTGANNILLATAGPGGAACAANCGEPSVSPDNKEVAFGQAGAGNGIAEVNSDGTTVTPRRLTTAIANDQVPSYSPDNTKIALRRDGALATAPADGSGTVTTIPAITGLAWLNWGPATGSGTGTGTGTGTGAAVISVTATRTGANCVFNITATPAAAGITVDFSITNPKGVVKLTGNDVSVPASPSVKAKKRGKNKVRNITLSDAKGATIGTASATCAK